MKPPKKADVFCKWSWTFHGRTTINGNLYVRENLNLTANNERIEIFGNLIVKENILANNLVVHGDLICNILTCNSVEVDGNIVVSSVLQSNQIKSNEGSIFITNEATIKTIIASQGYICIGTPKTQKNTSILVHTFKAFDRIIIYGNVTCLNTMIAGTGIFVSGSIFFDRENFAFNYVDPICISISTYSGEVRSKNINIMQSRQIKSSRK